MKEDPSRAWANINVVVVGTGQTFSARIEVKDILVLGLGDSFASGEGNPDKPAKFSGRPNGHFPLQDQEAYSYWLDRICHRSLYSQQARAAMQLAAYNAHTSVTFISFSCSGAAVVDLFKEYEGQEKLLTPPDWWKRPQFDSVVETLCRTKPVGAVGKKECPGGFTRPIDFLLLSIGGNDIGFVPVVTGVTATVGQLNLARAAGLLMVGPSGVLDAVLTPEKAERQIDRLLADKGEGRFKKLRRQIQDTLQIREGWRVLITLYPNIVHESYDESKKKGVLCGDGPHKSKHKNGLRLIAKNAEITKDESERVFDRLLIPLNEFIRGNNNEQPESDRWTIVDEHVDKFGDHGWCASNYADQLHDAQDHVEMPEFDRHRWKPLSPVDYAPYANRARWVRTPNDAYLTTSLQKRPHKRFWNIFKAALKHRLWGANGAFHPTAMGHAVTADAVYEQLSRLMKERYRVEKDENYEPNTRVSQI